MAVVRGKRTCACMAEWFYVMEKEAKRQGIVKNTVDIYQLIGNASASAGYHRSGACGDFKQASEKFIKLCRNMGAAAWKRDRSDGMILHTHLALKGCPHLTSGAKAQVGELERGGDGLVGSRRDKGPRSGVKWPLRSWKEGVAWAKVQGKPTQSTQNPPSGVDRMDPDNYKIGAVGPHVRWLDERLVVHGIKITPTDTFTTADKAAVEKFQRAQGWTGAAADGLPGPETLKRLAANP